MIAHRHCFAALRRCPALQRFTTALISHAAPLRYSASPYFTLAVLESPVLDLCHALNSLTLPLLASAPRYLAVTIRRLALLYRSHALIRIAYPQRCRAALFGAFALRHDTKPVPRY